eukprot:11276244-Alexandrium_andersonii.AAC.1
MALRAVAVRRSRCPCAREGAELLEGVCVVGGAYAVTAFFRSLRSRCATWRLRSPLLARSLRSRFATWR